MKTARPLSTPGSQPAPALAAASTGGCPAAPPRRARPRALRRALASLALALCAVWAAPAAAAIPLGDALDNTSLTWTSGGVFVGQTAAETDTHDGVDAAHTISYTDGMSETMTTTVTGPGTLTFWYKVNSESGFDNLRFSVDGSQEFAASGVVDWTLHTVSLAPGSHTLTWNFSTDGSVTVAGGGAWVDQVVNTIRNASFETNGGNPSTSATGWTNSGGVTFFSGQGATNGDYAAVFNGNSVATGGKLWQTLSTVAGRAYTVVIDFGAAGDFSSTSQILAEVRNGTSSTSGNQTINSGSGAIATNSTDGTLVTNGTTIQMRDTTGNGLAYGYAPNAEFSVVSFTFTAQGNSSTLVFTDQSTGGVDSQDAVIDNVRVVESVFWNGFASPAGTNSYGPHTVTSTQPWTFNTRAGVYNQGVGGFDLAGTNYGQFGFLQSTTATEGAISAPVTFPVAGAYKLEWLDAGRANAGTGYAGNASYYAGFFGINGLANPRSTTTAQPLTRQSDGWLHSAGTTTIDFYTYGATGDETAILDNINLYFQGYQPTITAPGAQSIPMNGTTGALSFTVGDAETTPAYLTMTRSSSNTTLIPTANVGLGGSGTNRTVTVTPAAGRTGVATITLTVNDGTGTTSRTFTVAVYAAPTVTTTAATGVSYNGATLNATVNPNSLSTSVTFQYSLDATFSSGVATTSATAMGASATASPVSTAISGLTAGATYYYRAVGSNSSGTINGAILSFTAEPVNRFTWGANGSGQFGDGTTAASVGAPTAGGQGGALAGKTITAISAGETHALALDSDGKVYAWGNNTNGQLGNGSTTASTVPVAVDMAGVLAGKTVTAVRAGQFHSVALTSDGRVYAWGGNTSGQLGDATITQRTTPVAVSTTGVLSGKTITKIAAGWLHTVALDSDGKVYAWGENTSGRLGNNSTIDRNVPVAVVTSGVLSGKVVTAIAAGSQHTVALDSGGKVYAWGEGSSGRLGHSSTSDSSVPVAVTATGVLSGKVVSAIAAGELHTVALATDGAVYTWGEGSSGQLGENSTIDRSSPVAVVATGVLAGKTVTAIGAGQAHTVAVTSDGLVFAWGDNGFSQLGDGTTTDRDEPVAVSTAGNLSGRPILAVSVGFNTNFVFVVVPPAVSSPTSTDITSTGATLGGTVANDGSGAITGRGIVFSLTSTNAGPILGGSGVRQATASGTTGVFTTAASNLASGASYSFRAYASNSAGTTYTSVETFTTPVAAFTHGSFETHGGTNLEFAAGWAIIGTNNDIESSRGATDGTFALSFNDASATTSGYAAQTFATVAGQTYAVQFDFGARGSSTTSRSQLQVEVRNGSSPTSGTQLINSGSGSINTTTGGVLLSNTTLLQVKDESGVNTSSGAAPNAQFSALSFTFTATGSVSTLVFTDQSAGGSDNQQGVLDNVRVVSAASAPTLTSVSTLTGASEDAAFSISYATLAAAADEADANGDAIGFRVEAVSSGTLTKGGSAVTPGTTLLGTGETWVWTPAANASGTLAAFTVRATDGTAASASPVQVSVSVAAVNDAPTVTLNGPATVTVEAGGTYTEQGATGADIEDGALTPVITGTLNTAVVGTYTKTYTVTDSGGLTASTTRTVSVIDTTKPVVTAPAGGFSPLTITAAPGAGGTAGLPDYTAQAVVTDNATGALTRTQVPAPGTEHAPGTVAVSLTATDAAGNVSNPVAFNVTVEVGNTAPMVALDGAVYAFSNAGSLTAARLLHTMTQMQDGTVLAIGGSNSTGLLASTEIYNPVTGTWSAAASLATARRSHTATRLQNGKVLVVGGINPSALSSAELYDPGTDTWSPAGNLATRRFLHAATLLNDGRVLVTGGRDGTSNPSASGELYDPATNSWSVAASFTVARRSHAATLLPSGKVLLMGGYGSGALASAELYDPAANAWSLAASLGTPREGPTATLLLNGKVLVAGGSGTPGFPANGELYDPMTNTWAAAGNLAAGRRDATAALLPSGAVILAAGFGSVGELATVEVYDPVSNAWSAGGNLAQARQVHAAASLPDGRVLIAGGSGGGILASTELYALTMVAATGTEGSPAMQTGTFSDAQGNATVTLSASTGAVVKTGAATWSWSPLAGFDGPSTGTVTITATDDAEETATVGFTFTATNAAPTAGIAAPASANEDASVSIDFTATDASTVDRAAGFAWVLNFGDGSAVENLAAGTASPLSRIHTFVDPGTYTVTATATDKDSGTSTTATHAITIADVTAPDTTITSGPSGTVNSASAAFAFSANEASTFSYALDGGAQVANATGAVNFFGLSQGAHTFSVFAIDAAGNPDATPATRMWTVQLDPESSLTASKGSAVPGAGVDSGIAAGAVFTTFGIPSINDAGDVAFLAKWSAPMNGAIPAQSGTGIFAGNPAALVVKVGGAATAGTTFTALKDPVLNAAGKIAFTATVAGTGITSANDTALFTNAFAGGAMTLVAQEGVTADATDSATIKSFTSYSLQGAEVLYVAKLQAGTPVVTSANDAGAYGVTASATTKVVRENDDFSTTKVKSFKLLAATSGSPGENRAHTEGNAAFLVLLLDGKQALVDSTGGTLTAFAQTGQVTGGTTLPAATFKSFGPVAAPDTTYSAMVSTLTAGVGGVTSANARGVFLGNGSAFEPVARITGVTGIGAATFSAFKDPVLAPATGAIAFPATIKSVGVVTSADDTTLWWQPAAGALTLLAREGAEPAETGTGVKWKAFTSLAIAGGAGGGPLFYATLLQGSGGVTALNDAGLWAVDSTGALRLLAREGDLIGAKTLKSMTVLTAVSGSPGVTRSFNNAGEVIYRATFTDGSQSLVTVQVP